MSELSERLQKLRSSYFPFVTTSGVKVQAVNLDTVRSVFDSLEGSVFPARLESPPFTIPDARREIAQPLFDAWTSVPRESFVFYDPAGTPIGWSMGDQSDASSFYMRNTGIVESWRGRRIYSEFLKQFLLYMREAGYERITSHHKLHNRGVLIAKLKAGFNIQGTLLDERFGQLVSLVYFTNGDRQAHFERRGL
jgi:hypothetical protein